MAIYSWAPRVLSLCSGIGGLDLGVKLAAPRARAVLYVERELYAAGVLVARMEDGALDRAPVWSDLATLPAGMLRGRVDLVIGGIPCQPFSAAGKRRGTEDERWLWPMFWRAVCEVDAGWIFLENVPGLLGRGVGDILRDLAGERWVAEWGVFSAAEVGAPHLRQRLFILAHAGRERRGQVRPAFNANQLATNLHDQQCQPPMVDTLSSGRDERTPVPGRKAFARAVAERAGIAMGNAERAGLAIRQGVAGNNDGEQPTAERAGSILADTRSSELRQAEVCGEAADLDRARSSFPPGPNDMRAWADVPLNLKPAICRLADGTSARLDELRALGNAVVPAVAARAFQELWGRLMKPADDIDE